MAQQTKSGRLVSLSEIQGARHRLPAVVRNTPVLPLARDAGEAGRERLYVKASNLQVTGAFKPGGAFNVLLSLDLTERARGVVLSSSGNFSQAFAFAGATLGVRVVVVMMAKTSPAKIAATQAYGAEVLFCANDPLARHPMVVELGAERNMVIVNTLEDLRVIAGHGVLGLEILEQVPDVETILVPVSSGGLAAGIATAVKAVRPDVRVVGVQPERAKAAYLSLDRGHPVTIDSADSIADGLSLTRPGDLPFRHLQAHLDEIVLVPESAIASAFRTLFMQAKLVAEPAGAVAAAAFLTGKVETSRKTVALVTGGNLTAGVVKRLLVQNGDDREQTPTAASAGEKRP